MTLDDLTPLEWIAKSLPAYIWKAFKGDPNAYFEAFISDLIAAGVNALQNGRNRTSESEDALTELLVASLKPAYTIIPEGNSNGHVDVFVKTLFPGLEWKGEAKILKSYPWYETGLVKLVAKYNSGAEDRTFLIGYCLEPEMHAIASEYKTKIETGKPADFQKWGELASYSHANLFVGEHLASGRPILVAHVWSNCYYATDKVVAEAKGSKTRKKPKAAKKKIAPVKTPRVKKV